MSTDTTPISFRSFQLHSTLLGEPLPPSISLESTNHCNLRCTHCGHTQYTPFVKGYLDEAYFDKILPHLGPDKISSVNLSDFGEPFMSKGFWKIFSRTRAIGGLRIGFITNAVLLDRHLDKLDYPGLDITISIDGASEQTFAQFRGAGYFDKIVQNLRLLREREVAGTLPQSSRSFIAVLSVINVHEMAAIVELAAEVGVKMIAFSFQTFYEEQRFRKESLYFHRALYDRSLAAACARAADLGVTVIFPDAFDGSIRVPRKTMPKSWLWQDEQGRTQCGVIYSTCYIKFHGQVEACCVQDRYPLGNLNEDEFSDIWHGPYYRRLRQSFATGEWTAPCENCNLMQSIDARRQEAHYIIPLRDGGELISMPQPYRINDIEIQYQSVLQQLALDPGHPEKAMPSLLRIGALGPELTEITNAIAVSWLTLGQTEKGLNLLRKAARRVPGDSVIAHNLRTMDQGETRPTASPAEHSGTPGNMNDGQSARRGTPLRWIDKMVKRR